MTTPTTTREAESYLAEVREHLDDLREEERAELLQDLAQHLTDLGTDESNSDKDIRQLLGSPAAYAAELRSAAGLPPRHTVTAPGKERPAFVDWLIPFWNHRWVRPGRQLASDLAPAWWMARGYLVAVIPFWLNPYAATSEDFPIPRYGGSVVLGGLAIVAATAASIVIGRWGKRDPNPAKTAVLLGLNAVLVLAALTAYGAVHSHFMVLSRDHLQTVSRMSQQIGSMSTSLETPFGTVTNIYPYDAQGNPLENVLLFDQDGRPLRSGTQEWWKDGCRRQILHPQAADGGLVEFSYPYRYAAVMAGGPDGNVFLTCPEPPRPTVPIPPLPMQPFPLGQPQP